MAYSDTHAILPSEYRHQRIQRAACGTRIHTTDAVTAPSCADCRKELAAEAAESAQYATVEEELDALFGPPPAPGSTPPVEHFSSTSDYRQKGSRR